MALKDLLLALKWFNANADAFGADRERITVGGHSAGGALSHFMALAPVAQEYFQRSLVMSGTAMNPWSIADYDLDDQLWDLYLLGMCAKAAIPQ